MPDYSGKEELYPGVLLGYRSWIVNLKDLRLRPLSGSRNFTWMPGINSASCANNYKAPCKDHLCGLYAKYNPELEYGGSSDSNSNINGVVEVHGTLQLGIKGLRAEHAEIKALTYEGCNFNKRIVNLIAEDYEIPVFDSVVLMCKHFPPSDLTGIIDITEKELVSEGRDLKELADFLKKVMDKGLLLLPEPVNVYINQSSNTTNALPQWNYDPATGIVTTYGAGACSTTNPNFTWHWQA